MKSPSRRAAREAAMQALYRIDLNPDTTEAEVVDFLAEQLHYPKLEAFALARVRGVRTNLPKIDAELSRSADRWTISRMAAVDRNLLRLAAYELIHCPDVPAGVILNEAIEIAKRFSSADSAKFANGVLDRLHRRVRSEPSPQSDPEEHPLEESLPNSPPLDAQEPDPAKPAVSQPSEPPLSDPPVMEPPKE